MSWVALAIQARGGRNRMPTPRGGAAEAAGSVVATRAGRRRRRGRRDIGLHPSCTCEQYRIGAGWGSRAVVAGTGDDGVARPGWRAERLSGAFVRVHPAEDARDGFAEVGSGRGRIV